jgi:hypothetical protein
MIIFHHIISDGGRACSRNSPPSIRLSRLPNPLPSLLIQYADFSQWQREWLQGERLESQLAYWKKQLGGEIPHLEALLEKPRPALASLQSGRASLTLSPVLVQALRRSSQQDATLFIYYWLPSSCFFSIRAWDIAVGSPVRSCRAGLENLAASF